MLTECTLPRMNLLVLSSVCGFNWYVADRLCLLEAVLAVTADATTLLKQPQ